MLLFNHLDMAAQRKIVPEMYERAVPAGEILIQEGDTGAGQAFLPCLPARLRACLPA